jgi:hypothetical protein
VQHREDLLSILLGILSTIAGHKLGWIPMNGLLQAMLLGAMGSAGGYLGKKCVESFIKYIQAKLKKSKR